MVYFKETGTNLFCQDYLIQEALRNTNQFLVKLNKYVDFEKIFRNKLVATYKGKCTLGRPSYKPELILKMLFLSYLFKLPEREIERVVNDSISMKSFLGISLDEAAPDHSSLTKFRNRILHYEDRQAELSKSRNIFKEVFDEIILLAQEKRIDLGFVQSLDSTHTIADVNTKKEKKRTKKISDGGEGKAKRDKSAKWGTKRVKEVKTVEGKKVKVRECYFGYKNHFSVSAKSNLITSYKVTAMNVYDGHYLLPLLQDDFHKNLIKPLETIYTADKAYHDGENHSWLNQYKILDAIDLKNVKEEDKTEAGKPKARFTQYTNQEKFEEGLKERYTVERVNADVKKWHGLDRARYLGIKKMEIQTAMTALAHNLKTLVKLWSGIGLRDPVTVHVY